MIYKDEKLHIKYVVNIIFDGASPWNYLQTTELGSLMFELQDFEIKQEVDSPLLVEESDEAYFERGTQWLVDLLPKPVFHAPPDSDEEHVSVNDDDGNLVGVIVQSKRARLAAEAAEKLKKKFFGSFRLKGVGRAIRCS